MMGERESLWTRSGVRLKQLSAGRGRWNWLFVPGGPGLGSESLRELVPLATAGAGWLLDLPGDGSNRPRTPAAQPYSDWPRVLLDAARTLENLVMVGHSTGGMFILSVPELQQQLAGLALVSSAPHAGWRQAFAAHTQQHPLPEVAEAAARYTQHPDDATLRELTLAAAPWNFTAPALATGRTLLGGLPYNYRAAAWAAEHFDDTYRARWSPLSMPALIVSGADDTVVTQRLWQQEPGFTRPNVLHRNIAGAGHFPWIDNPQAVQSAFVELTDRLETASDAAEK